MSPEELREKVADALAAAFDEKGEHYQDSEFYSNDVDRLADEVIRICLQAAAITQKDWDQMREECARLRAALADCLRTLEDAYLIESDRRQSIRLAKQALGATNSAGGQLDSKEDAKS